MLENVEKLGENDHYWFGVGQFGDRWAGFAIGTIKKEGEADHDMLFLFPNLSDKRSDLGMQSKEQCIRYTLATAQHPPAGYGGIARWFVDEPLRVIDPTEFVCPSCDTVHPGNCEEFYD